MLIGLIVLAVIVILGIFVVTNYNALTKLKNKVKANWAQIDVQLKRRADLIPNIVETVKGYAKHESETLENAIKARSNYVNASTPQQQMEASGELNQALSRLMMLQEAYPDLKANTNFMSLQNDLKDTEDKIAYARQFYNDAVYTYTNKLEMFPSNIIAGLFHFPTFEMFKVEEKDTEVPKVSF
ncbi:MAG: LemA family protein [Thomasclavelia sp.]|jgi:LemA protein|nr:LemA family protein [Thomasclavelia sp.]